MAHERTRAWAAEAEEWEAQCRQMNGFYEDEDDEHDQDQDDEHDEDSLVLVKLKARKELPGCYACDMPWLKAVHACGDCAASMDNGHPADISICVGGNQRYWGVRPKKKKDRAVDHLWVETVFMGWKLLYWITFILDYTVLGRKKAILPPTNVGNGLEKWSTALSFFVFGLTPVGFHPHESDAMVSKSA